ncbi:MAG TPA: hypothetical protein VFF13_05885 [archaeon]|nr:hypothetical protein [archaeon]
MQKTVLREKGYSKKELARIEAALKGAEKARKNPKIMKELEKFIKKNT